jgi:hypothetical protein
MGEWKNNSTALELDTTRLSLFTRHSLDRGWVGPRAGLYLQITRESVKNFQSTFLCYDMDCIENVSEKIFFTTEKFLANR